MKQSWIFFTQRPRTSISTKSNSGQRTHEHLKIKLKIKLQNQVTFSDLDNNSGVDIFEF